MSAPVVLERLPGNPAGLSSQQSGKYKQQRVYIFPTLQGWLYGTLLIVMLLGAINYNNSMAFMLCFLLTSLGIVCLLHTYQNLTGLVVIATKPKPVFAGQKALFPIQIDNRYGIARFSITLEQKHSRKKWFKRNEEQEQISISIEADKQQTAYYPVQTRQRGLCAIDRLMISTNFPLGIFRAWSYFTPEQHGIVYPKPDGDKLLPLSTIQEEEMDYGTKSGTDDFSGFRKYRSGDPINSIAWKAYAREQGLLVKQFSGKGSRFLILSWDNVSNINNIESRLSQLCYWVLIAEQAGIQYGLQIPGVSIEQGHGIKHKELCLEALALYGLKHA